MVAQVFHDKRTLNVIKNQCLTIKANEADCRRVLKQPFFIQRGGVKRVVQEYEWHDSFNLIWLIIVCVQQDSARAIVTLQEQLGASIIRLYAYTCDCIISNLKVVIRD